MAWVRTVSGRLKSDYRYTPAVYGNFPWPQDFSDKKRKAISAAAKDVLNARAKFPNSSLAELYNSLTMPPALTKAHVDLDRSVDAIYGGTKYSSDAERVAFLFELYEKQTSLLPGAAKMKPATRGRKKPKKSAY